LHILPWFSVSLQVKIQEFELDSSLLAVVAPAALQAAGEMSCSVELNRRSTRAGLVF